MDEDHDEFVVSRFDNNNFSDDDEFETEEEITDNMDNDVVNGEQHSEGDEGLDYDVTLPAQHSYLGNNLHELPGRVVLDEDSIINLPIISLSGVIMIPGQILPLELEHPTLINMMMGIINKDRTFGILAKDRKIGTTVEIRNYRRSDGDDGTESLKITAEGRQRFTLLETIRMVDGVLMGKVKILCDIELVHPFDKNLNFTSRGNRHNRKLLPYLTVWPYFVYRIYDPCFMMKEINQQLQAWANISTPNTANPAASKLKDVQESVITSPPIDEDDDDESGFQIKKTVVTTIRTADTIEEESDESSDDGDNEVFSQALQSPSKFSYWVAANLPLSDDQRIKLLQIPTTIERLRCECDFLKKCLYLCCISCGSKISTREDIFPMNSCGPMQNYVNRAHQVFETLTVYQATNVTSWGTPSTEASWFPGYAWTFCNCSECGHHLGWKFLALKKVRPEYFWGLARVNIKPQAAPRPS